VAHGAILTALYLPVAVMLIGLILRGVAFEFRVKAPGSHKETWNRLFFAGSLMTSLSQGFMLGLYIMGLEWTWPHVAFACVTAVFLTVGYSFIGATWLILKTEGALQEGRRLGARRHLGPGPRHRRDLGRLAARQPAHLRESGSPSPRCSGSRRCRSCRRR
jgi:cytochrome bd-type quinol oxidase subunit 2